MKREKNVFELVLEFLDERFKDEAEKASLAKSMFKEYLISGRKGLEKIVKEHMSKILEEE
ncbi:MAG: hypothetical protein DRJ39_03720 [Thermoprotei archaeon]|nr:MAG: hypothetical protein DRZ80_04745 [Thermoprotei archaeon]RLE77539.1 MAG: hypothetical protein DRJ44_01810 [Thermoprotei archaeon]RLE84098.1 MAG: hypothetical protein DRJ39_03720 [Thermoprotei archaeon]